MLFLRVEGYNPKKRKIFYSKNYYYRLPPPEPEASPTKAQTAGLPEARRSIFFSAPHYIQANRLKKNAPPPVACLPPLQVSPLRRSPSGYRADLLVLNRHDLPVGLSSRSRYQSAIVLKYHSSSRMPHLKCQRRSVLKSSKMVGRK